VSLLLAVTSGATNYTITAQAGTYSVTGQSATLLRSKLIVASNGSYAVTGQSATLLRSRLITASNGAYAINGQSVTITYGGGAVNYLLVAQAGSYAVTGSAASIDYQSATKQGGLHAPYILPVRYKQFKRAEEVLEALPEQAQEAVRAVVAQVGIESTEAAQRQALRQETELRKMAYKAAYLEAIQLEIIRQQVLIEMKQEEEAVFVMITALLSN
jgi:Ca2+-binding RTX toxin-like protein